MSTRIKPLFFIVGFTLAVVFSANAQMSDTQTVQSADGVILIRNDKIQRFSFFVAGKNSSVRQTEDGSISIDTDEGGLYAYFVKTTEFLDPTKRVDHANILEAHRDRDLEAEEKAQQIKLDATKGADLIAIKDVTNPLFPKRSCRAFTGIFRRRAAMPLFYTKRYARRHGVDAPHGVSEINRSRKTARLFKKSFAVGRAFAIRAEKVRRADDEKTAGQKKRPAKNLILKIINNRMRI